MINFFIKTENSAVSGQLTIHCAQTAGKSNSVAAAEMSIGSTQVNESARELSSLAENLTQLVQQFKI